jgi:pilus assembly protein Flp/PilA
MRFLKQDGQDIVEYALLIGFMALALTASLNSVASAISNVFTTVGGTLNDAV